MIWIWLACTGDPVSTDSGDTPATTRPPPDSGGTTDTDSSDTGGHTGDTAPPIDSGLFLIDSDGDGLSDGLELRLGWDPEREDTDGDGWTDGEEYAAGTDGSLAWSWPLEGCRWPELREQATALAGDQATGADDGDIVPDLVWVDQCGGEVSPWQFPGHVVVLDFAAAWCPPCQEAAPMLEATFQRHRERGYMLLTALQGDTPETAAEWATDYGAHHVVAADVDRELGAVLEKRSTTLPTYVLVDAEMVVRKVRIGETTEAWFDLYVPGLQDERDAQGGE